MTDMLREFFTFHYFIFRPQEEEEEAEEENIYIVSTTRKYTYVRATLFSAFSVKKTRVK
jgi:hypothetical protein